MFFGTSHTWRHVLSPLERARRRFGMSYVVQFNDCFYGLAPFNLCTLWKATFETPESFWTFNKYEFDTIHLTSLLCI